MILRRFIKTFTYQFSAFKPPNKPQSPTFFKNKNQIKQDKKNIQVEKNNQTNKAQQKKKLFTKSNKTQQKYQQMQELQPKKKINWLEMKPSQKNNSNVNFKVRQLLNKIQNSLNNKQEIQFFVQNNDFSSVNLGNLSNIIESILFNQIYGIYDKNTKVKLIISCQIIQKCTININGQGQLEKKSRWFAILFQNYVKLNQSQVSQDHKIQLNKFISYILTSKPKLINNKIYISQYFIPYLQKNYYGKDSQVFNFINIIKNVNLNGVSTFETFYKKIEQSFMLYKIKNGFLPFKINSPTPYHYQLQNKQNQVNLHQVIICTFILCLNGYTKQLQYLLSYGQKTLKEFQYKDIKIIFKNAIFNYYIHNHNKINFQKLQNIQKVKLKILQNNLEVAYQIFQQKIFKEIVIQRWKRNTQFALKKYALQNLTSLKGLGKQIKKNSFSFLNTVENEWFWSFYKEDQQFSQQFKSKLPQNHLSFWNQTFKIQRQNQIYQLEASGKLNELAQLTPKQSQIFNLNQYLQKQYPTAKKSVDKRYIVQKQLLKYAAKMESLIYESMTMATNLLQPSIKDAQQSLCQENLKLIQNCGLKDPPVEEDQWKQWIVKFYKFKADNMIFKQSNQYGQFLKQTEKQQKNQQLLNMPFLKQLKFKRRDLWHEAKQLVKIRPNPLVSQLILWGLYKKIPFAIYLGQKLAMITNETIPDYLASRVSDMFSYRRSVDEQILKKCKNALKVIGCIERQNIYTYNKDYHHIGYRKGLHSLAFFLNVLNLGDPRLQEIQPFIPSWVGRNQQPSYLIESAKKRLYQ